MSVDAISHLNAALAGRYVIERRLGEGGMATVYLAADFRHQRKVALKVLKPELAAVVGAERFLAEIKTTANLQHPHILPLFDSGVAGSFLFYVMPSVEGESLRERLDREHQLPVSEAVAIATSVAEALDYAHRHGVIHRDIKPANILLQDGKPVLSDFGIALAVGVAGGGRLTETGLSLGTPHYMSPEQATGDQHVYAATDIYALGCVLYEMLVGDPPYTGSTAQAVLGKIIQGEPVSAAKSRRTVPPHIDSVIRRAIERHAADRFATARDFAAALANPSFRHGEAGAAARVREGVWKPLALAASASAIALASVLTWALLRPATPLPVERYESPFRAGQEPVYLNPGGFRLSPDGSLLAYLGPVPDAAGSQLWVRRWDDPEAVPVRGTAGAVEVAVSPDGRELAFSQGGELKVLALEGGPSRVLAGDVVSVVRWHADDYISFVTPDGDAVRVPAAGGAVELVSAAREGEARRYLLQSLPGGDRALVGVQLLNQAYELHAVDLGTGESVFLTSGIVAYYTDTGHLVFSSDGALMAAPFDARAMELTGPPVALVDGITAYSLSTNGRLAYSGGGTASTGTELIWVTRSGDATPVESGWTFDRGGGNPGWSLSPDGTRIAVQQMSPGGNLDIWIKDLPAGPLRRLTFDQAEQRAPFWTPDGARVTYFSGPAGTLGSGDVWWSRADGTGQPELILAAMPGFAQGSWSPDASALGLRNASAIIPGQPVAENLLMFRPTIDTAALPLLAAAAYAERDPAISRDGRWIAYSSNETGRQEVFVRPFPDVDAAKIQVSTDGGSGPLWSRDGRELFYIDGARRLVAVRFDASSGFAVTAQERLFEIPPSHIGGLGVTTVDVTPDGERFLMGRSVAGSDGVPDGPRLVLVHNFFEELRRRVPR
ncbi:MAG: protein kinase [Longimicrobiales bacterium]